MTTNNMGRTARDGATLNVYPHRYYTRPYIPAIEHAMREAMAEVGIVTDDAIVADGQMHRIHIDGDRPGTRNGWYVLHRDGRAAGVAGNWRTGASCRYVADCPQPTHAERRMTASRVARDRARAEAQRNAELAACAVEARQVWNSATPASPSHPYLISKHVEPHELRQNGQKLLVPLVDMSGRVLNVQRIDPNGTKRFAKGRAKGLFSPLGELAAPVWLLICEGWATGATLHESYGYPVLAAMSAHNLLLVARAARGTWPRVNLVIAAENDRHTPGNPGLTCATEAARATSARLMVPPFNDGEEGTDWNDYAALRRGEAGHD